MHLKIILLHVFVIPLLSLTNVIPARPAQNSTDTVRTATELKRYSNNPLGVSFSYPVRMELFEGKNMVERSGVIGDLFEHNNGKAFKIVEIFDPKCPKFEGKRREISIWHSTCPWDAGNTRLENDKTRKIGGRPFKYFNYSGGGAGSYTACEGYQFSEAGTYWCFSLCSYGSSGEFTDAMTGQVREKEKRHDDQDEKNFQETFEEIMFSTKWGLGDDTRGTSLTK